MIFFRSCAILTLRLEVQKTENGVFHLYRIFIVEDDGVIAGAVERHLESWGYQVARARKFDAVLEEFTEFDPQLVLLDISLPFFNGYHWCREIRKTSKVPILFLTSAADNVNLVMAMQMGGDDLLAKPFDLQVLSAKVQAMLRRAYDFAAAPAALLACGGAAGLRRRGAERLQWDPERPGPAGGADKERGEAPPAFAGEKGPGRQPGRHDDRLVGVGQLCG